MATNNINRILLKEWSFHSSVYVPTGVSDLSSGSPEAVDLTLDAGGVGLVNTEAVNSDQVDLGVNRTDRNSVVAALEWFAAITAGLAVTMFWSGSANSSVNSGNPGKPDGGDGAWTGDGGGTVPETVKQIQFIGSFLTTDLVGVQIAKVGGFRPHFQYGQLIVVNNSGTFLCGDDDIESSVLFYGTINDIAAAV